MSANFDCPGCEDGQHDRHDAAWGTRPGLLGGVSCSCRGDCAERHAARLKQFDAMFPVRPDREREK